jgi:hypothetical protein
MDQLKLGRKSDALAQAALDRATSAINLDLKFSFDGYTAGNQVIYSYGGPTLMLPPHQIGQTITVTDPGGAPVTGFVEQTDGHLYLGNGYILNRSWYYGWGQGRYLVNAKWGYGTAPDALVEVCIEVAANILREKDKGTFSDAIGVEAGGEVRVGYAHAFTNRQRAILDRIKELYTLPAVV